MNKSAVVIGAGLAGCEAAWQLAERGVKVTLWEMKPEKKTPAHQCESFAELVCSNSLRGAELSTAPGLLKEEMRRLGGLVIRCADENRVEAGGALAVDREAFSKSVTERIKNHENIAVRAGEVTEIPKEGPVIIATGPLTSDAFFEHINGFLGGESALHFFDAAAPIVTGESIDSQASFRASRYGKGSADYINCPMTPEEYEGFWQALCTAQEAPVHGFEDARVFEGCMPVEVMARRGHDTLRFGPLKPAGLTDPKTGRWPYAVVQLRQDNAAGTLYNLVGFQTHLRFPEQKRVFSMIPALKNAEFVRYGVMHRNTFLNSPRFLDRHYRLKICPRIRFAGQITGVEGYVESMASGLAAGLCLAQELAGREVTEFPDSTAIGALGLYISNGAVGQFQPMNINFGIIRPLGIKIKGKQEKNKMISQRSLSDLAALLPNIL